MGTYHVIQDYFGLSQLDALVEPDVISVSSYWVLAVIQFKYPNTYRRVNKASFSKNFPEATEIRGMLVITSDCQSMSIMANKATHIPTLSANLLPGEANYLNEIMPGDYVMAWMMNDEATYLGVLDRIKDGKSANSFMDGLKFVGQVQNISKVLTQSPEGIKSIRFPLTAAGFTQFDTQLYYEPHLAEADGALGEMFSRYGVTINQVIGENGKGIDVNLAIPLFLNVLLGNGVQRNFGRGNDDERLRATTGKEAPYAFVIPNLVGSILNKQNQSKPGGSLAFVDILQTIIGVQKYSGDQGGEAADASEPADDAPSRIFTPDNCQASGSTLKYTGTPMLGDFVPDVPQFTNHPVWSVLRQYLNPAVNEMYATLRASSDSQIVPTLVVRQMPFTTSQYQGDLNVTRYLELPRWKIHSALIRSVDLGRTDAMRHNFIHVYANVTNTGEPTVAQQVVYSPPTRDDLDIGRNGLRGHFETVPCSHGDAIGGKGDGSDAGPKKWMELKADILMGQHLTMSGHMTSVGIQAPICIGDNIEYDGVVLHIESVTHQCSIGMSGQKTFTTTLGLTHGYRAEPGNTDLQLYPGMRHHRDAVTTDDPGESHDDRQPPNEFVEIGDGEGIGADENEAAAAQKKADDEANWAISGAAKFRMR